MKKNLAVSVLALAAMVVAGIAAGQTAGSQTIGVTVTEVKVIAEGWSVKYALLGRPVYNLQKQKIGYVDDLIVTPERSLSYGILAVGGFLGIGARDVAIPVEQFQMEKNGKILLPGADKDALEAMPPFQYAK